MNHPQPTIAPTIPADLAALLERAEQDIAAQSHSYRTESDPDHADRCAWNTWRTLQTLVPAVRALLEQPNPAPIVATPRPNLRSAA
ncbi:hypothetical protein [Phaeacidiphilus oryzae]|uniref:hypothetical protein n=1 Tax=Phaeacidiphilus oryzae TaxID=348818 RepID=UPI00055BCFC1|nr:hypothetical protein [Phaeacidiphilus oryzae]